MMGKMPDESVDLIYADILYGTGVDFGDYQDITSDHLEVINFYMPRFAEMKRVLKKGGSIYLQLDWHISHYVRLLMDDIFGVRNFRNEIARIQCNPKNMGSNWGRIYDKIFYYVKEGAPYTWNKPEEPKTPEDIKRLFPKVSNGRRYTTVPLYATGITMQGDTGKPWNSSQGLIEPPTGCHWKTSRDRLDQLESEGRIEWSKTGNPRMIVYADEKPNKAVQNIWNIKNKSSIVDNGKLKYKTEKPLKVLTRIIEASSNVGDLVFDPFCGSGTSLLAAKYLGRDYIGCDISEKAIRVSNHKLLKNP